MKNIDFSGCAGPVSQNNEEQFLEEASREKGTENRKKEERI
jgi:hypothetical protein